MQFKNKILSVFGNHHLNLINKRLEKIEKVVDNILIDDFLTKHLFTSNKYIHSKRITHFLRSVYSQNGEDGIIEEIFRRISTTNKFFIEFGAHGIKNNTTFLLINGWNGLWIEGSKSGYEILKKLVPDDLKLNVHIKNQFINKDNIENILTEINVPTEPDLLSIDIDGNDFHIWSAIKNYRPRLVIIEYNATLGPINSLVIPYKKDFSWNGTSYFGASLKALEKLGKEKGYSLIGCDFTGTNAFFVQSEFANVHFEKPFSSENHYEPPRYFLQKISGHKQGVGTYMKY